MNPLTALALAALADGVDPSVIVACIAGVAAIIGAAFSWRASTHANRVASRKVDLEAYDRNIAYYEKLIANLEKELEKVRSAMDRVNFQLAQEQDVSTALRHQLRTMQAQLDLLDRALSEYRVQLPVQPPVMPGQITRQQPPGGPGA